MSNAWKHKNAILQMSGANGNGNSWCFGHVKYILIIHRFDSDILISERVAGPE